MKLTEDTAVKTLFDFIVDGGNHGGLTGLEAALYNLPLVKQILENQRIVDQLRQDEQVMGTALADIQNWVSKEGKQSTETIHGYLYDLLKISDSQDSRDVKK